MTAVASAKILPAKILDDKTSLNPDAKTTIVAAANNPSGVTEDWYGKGAPVSEICEALLANSAWQRLNASTYIGLIKRLEMMRDAGLPNMRVIAADTIERLGRIPRSNEGHAVDALEAVKANGSVPITGAAKTFILFFSHRWIRGDWCEELKKDLKWGSPERQAAMAAGHHIGDPDDADHSKAKALIEYTKFQKRMLAAIIPPDKIKIYFWIDWPCVNQDDNCADMATLPAYVAVSSIILAYLENDYVSRAWCMVELLMAYAYSAAGQQVYAINKGLVVTEYHQLTNRSLSFQEMVLPDPLEANVTKESDKLAIARLKEIAMNSKAYTCSRVCYQSFTSGICPCFCINVVCLLGCFGCCHYIASRDVKPGKAKIRVALVLNRPCDAYGRPLI
jgi:hypothetical protein